MPPPLAARQARRGPARPPAGWWRVGAAGGARGVVHQRVAREGDRAWHCRCLGWQAFRRLRRTAGRVTGPVDSQAGRDGNNRSPDRGHAYRRVAAGAHMGNPAAVRGRIQRETHMKTTQRHNKRAGFTLIEMVGVLAVIAILAALLVPKIFAAIEESHMNNAISAINTFKTGTMSLFGRNGVFTADAGGSTWGDKLLAANLIDKEPSLKIATATTVNCTAYDGAADPLFDYLDGTAANVKPSGNMVYVKLTGVAPERARELSRRIDGETPVGSDNLTPTDNTTDDTHGRVVYKITSGSATVYVYLAHK
jgi:prepilin-type N-terminal cleavage/methylation domain-containing protein